jgi:hypothetical protein
MFDFMDKHPFVSMLYFAMLATVAISIVGIIADALTTTAKNKDKD